MRKVIIAVFLSLLVCTNGYAAGYKVKLKDKNRYGTVFRISLPFVGDKVTKWNKAFQETIDISNKNCKTYNKKTFTFWSEHSEWYARDANGMLFPKRIAKDTFGIIQDMETGFKVKVRYFCGENIEEAAETFKNYHRYFSEEFSSKINLATIMYSETSVSPYKFKNLPEWIKPKTATEKAQQLKEDKKFAKIEQYKTTCTVLGFKLGTDKFADCTLKLYVADNKETTQIVQSSSGVQEMIIYDPDRERRIQQKSWNDFLHGRCSLNALSKNPC